MILVGRYRSPYTRRVAVTMHILGLAYEHRPLSVWPTNEDVLPLNPMGRVPVLILDDGQRLVESGYITEYLDALVGIERALTPQSGTRRLAVQRLVHLALGTQEKVVLANHERYRRPEGLSERRWIDRCEAQVAAGLALLDEVEPHPWLAGEMLTQADICVGVLCDHIRLTCPALMPAGRYPSLERLAEACGVLPAFAETAPDF